LNYESIYKFRFSGIDPQKKLGVWKEISKKIYNLMDCPMKVLDPAGGQLEFIGQIDAPERWVVDLVKYDSVAAVEGLRYVVSDIFKADLPTNHFDGVFVSNFLEHLRGPEDIAKLLKKIISHMTPGGRIAIMGPNYKYTAADYFDFADHIIPLSHLAVAEHLYAAGFELSLIIPKFVPFSVRGRLPPSPLLARLYLSLPLFWHFFGKQFLIVAKKPL
jgi:SAM-dependent methyltransferase